MKNLLYDLAAIVIKKDDLFPREANTLFLSHFGRFQGQSSHYQRLRS